MAERDFASAEKAEGRYTADSNSSGENIENALQHQMTKNSLRPELTHDSVLGMQSHGHYGDGDDNPYVHQSVWQRRAFDGLRKHADLRCRWTFSFSSP